MFNFNNENGGVLILTLMVVAILTMLGLAILPLSVMEYKISHHFSDFEKAYYLAEAGIEEAIAELNYNWDYKGSPYQNINNGVYEINVNGIGNSRTITAYGEIGTIKRTIEANVERSVIEFDVSEMKDFVIFSQGDLEIDELGNIYDGIIGCHGNLYFESATKDGNAKLLIKGEVLPNHKNNQNKNENYNDESFPSISNRNLMDLSSFNMEVYIDWLKTNFIVTEFDNILSCNNKLSIVDSDYPNEASSILIIQNYSEISLNGIFNGLIIINNSNTLKIHNKSIINGMIIFAGNDLELHKAGQEITINGSLICANRIAQKGNWKLKLNHNPSILSYLDAYLPNSFEIPNESDLLIRILNSKEIN